jgi:proteic killer suppression protein
MIDAAGTLDDLKAPPANRLEALKGDLKGFYSIRINDQYRIVFTFKNGNAHDVYRCLYITDYHN